MPSKERRKQPKQTTSLETHFVFGRAFPVRFNRDGALTLNRRARYAIAANCDKSQVNETNHIKLQQDLRSLYSTFLRVVGSRFHQVCGWWQL